MPVTNISFPSGHHVWARAEALLRRQREGGPAADMDEVVWLWEAAKRIRREVPSQQRIVVAAEEADALWQKAGSLLRNLMVSDGTDEEWATAYNLFMICDALDRGDHTL